MGEGGTDLERDVDRAASLLHSLAVELIHVAVDPCTRELHIRALEFKRDVARWSEVDPGPEVRARTIDDLEALRRDAVFWREEQPSGRDLLLSGRSPRFVRRG